MGGGCGARHADFKSEKGLHCGYANCLVMSR